MDRIGRPQKFLARGVWLSFVVAGFGGCGEIFLACPDRGCGGEAGSGNAAGDGDDGTPRSGGFGGVNASGGKHTGLAGRAGAPHASGGDSASGGNNWGGACGDRCGEETPYCLEDEAICVECQTNEHCEDANRPLCNSSHDCVRCRSNEECSQAFPGRGLCVKTIGREEYGACLGCLTHEDCDGKVCDPETHLCTEFDYRSRVTCAACGHDLECKENLYCVPQEYDGIFIGTFCLETQESRVGPDGDCDVGDGPPYVDSKELTSLGGVKTRFCVLATTTCPGYTDHRKQKEGCTEESPEADAVCGYPGVDDAFCRKKQDGGGFYCSYQCVSEIDCMFGDMLLECIDGGTERHCAL